jgi:hypothetical protein
VSGMRAASEVLSFLAISTGSALVV